jgi:hypothetical protein
MTFSGLANTKDDDNGNIYKSVIRIKHPPNLPTMYVTSHEEGHSFIAPRTHAQTIQSPITIMRAHGPYLSPNPGDADCEAGQVLYEDTYTAGSNYDDVLGTEFNEIISGIPGITIIQ